MTRKGKESRIPKFAGIEEEAEFCATHSTAGYEHDFKPVKVRVDKDLSVEVTIRLVRPAPDRP